MFISQHSNERFFCTSNVSIMQSHNSSGGFKEKREYTRMYRDAAWLLLLQKDT